MSMYLEIEPTTDFFYIYLISICIITTPKEREKQEKNVLQRQKQQQ